ncbi:uncharacterized protein LOC106965081 [Poecilia latipinna]|uniref:uncharacterized protein LOC106965081 n=1 Tax=Poecilia latipinna TaxID=48699 RepID=UPI00072E9E7F|nr:PREDICTED: uncharacterized protein LOC106965081 [Poecilia latipinna]
MELKRKFKLENFCLTCSTQSLCHALRLQSQRWSWTRRVQSSINQAPLIRVHTLASSRSPAVRNWYASQCLTSSPMSFLLLRPPLAGSRIPFPPLRPSISSSGFTSGAPHSRRLLSVSFASVCSSSSSSQREENLQVLRSSRKASQGPPLLLSVNQMSSRARFCFSVGSYPSSPGSHFRSGGSRPFLRPRLSPPSSLCSSGTPPHVFTRHLYRHSSTFRLHALNSPAAGRFQCRGHVLGSLLSRTCHFPARSSTTSISFHSRQRSSCAPFCVYRDVICSVYPNRRIELDTYLALIADLHLQYGRSLFYQYHKAFANKPLAFCLVMAIKALFALLCLSSLDFPPQLLRSRSLSLTRSIVTADKCGFSILLQRRPSQVGLPPLHLSRQEPSRLQDLVSRFLSTPIHVPVLASFLTHYPDRSFVDFLITGLTQGFFIGLPQLPASSLVIPNLQSALNDPNAVSQLLQKEVSKGYVIGPCASPPFSHFRVNPLGVAVRKYSGKKRLILDLSAPHSGPHLSINSLIPKPPFSLHYATIDHVVALIKTAGPGAWLAKADITDAFKIMPVHPSQWHLLGAKWDAKFYFFVRLSFGCRSSPSLFNSLSEALCWILLNVVRLPFVLHLLDDFLLIDPPSHSSRSLSELKALFNRVGIPLSEEKTVGPSKRLEFLGITLDSKEMVASLPADKLSRIREISQAHLSSTTLSKRQLLSLLGHLNFAMRIIPQGRSFISRLLDLANSVPSLCDQVVLDAGCRSDLAFWSSLLNSWNGISFFYDDVILSADSMQFFTDAAPSAGFGGFFQGSWFAEKWPHSIPKSESSAFYEIIPIAAACCLWGRQWKRKHIVAFCDNAAVVEAINKGRSSSKSIMPFLRRITWQSVVNNFILSARHVPGHSNAIADALSRLQLQIFRRVCPSADLLPTSVPSFEDLILN